MRTHPKAKWYSFLILPALLLPFTVSGEAGVAVNDACAEGTCCPEDDSWCNIGGDDHEDSYKKSEGKCAVEET